MNTHKPEELDLRKELTELKSTVEELAQAYLQDMGDKLHKVPNYVKEGEEKIVQSMSNHPLMTVGIAALVGFVLGTMVTKR